MIINQKHKYCGLGGKYYWKENEHLGGGSIQTLDNSQNNYSYLDFFSRYFREQL